MERIIRLTELPIPALGQSHDFSLGDFRISWQHLREGLSRGVERLLVYHGENVVSVLPTRGMGIEFANVDGVRFGWNSPLTGPVHPQFVPLGEPTGLGWLDGFTELFVRCGLGSNGPPVFDERNRLVSPLHGWIANSPATNVEMSLDGDGRLTVRGVITESRFHFWKWKMQSELTIAPDIREVVVNDAIANMGGVKDRFQLLHHFNLGPPLLQPGSRLYVPALRVTPRNEHTAARADSWNIAEKPTAGDAERVWFVEPEFDSNGDSLGVLVNAEASAAAGIRFRKGDGMRCFTLWKNEVAEADGYVFGLEPATNWPNPRDFERKRGRCNILTPGQTQVVQIELIFATGQDRVAGLVSECERICPAAKTSVLDSIDPDISCQED